MSLKARRWLYSSFILAFFLITTLVISYANGYTISWTSGRLIKTGTFVFKTTPPNARIYLNGQLQTSYQRFGKRQDIVTPTKIKNLLPGEYKVRFELDGYHPWEKKLVVKSGESTYAETVELFSDSKPIAVNNENAKNLYLDAGNEVLAWLTENKVSMYDLKSFSTKLEIVGRPKSYAIQDSAEHILVDGSIYGSDLSVPLFSVAKLIGTDAKSIQFVRNQDKVAFILKNKIETVDLADQKISTVNISTSSEIINFAAYDDQLQVVIASSSRYFWQFYRNGELVRSAELPVGRYEFRWINEDWLSLQDADRELVYLLKAKIDNSQIKTVKHCRKIVHIKDNDFLCSNEYEIFSYNTESSASNLLDRISEPVLAAYWHKTNNYVIYLTRSGVFTLELDQRDFRNKTKVMDVSVSESAFDHDKNTLYISGEYGGQKGIFILNL
jgi:hypothetical protein